MRLWEWSSQNHCTCLQVRKTRLILRFDIRKIFAKRRKHSNVTQSHADMTNCVISAVSRRSGKQSTLHIKKTHTIYTLFCFVFCVFLLMFQTNQIITYTMIYELNISKKSRSLCLCILVVIHIYLSWREKPFFRSFVNIIISHVLFSIMKTLAK